LSFTGPPQVTAQPLAQHGLTGGSASFWVAVAGAAGLNYQWQKNGTNLSDAATIKGSSARVLTLSNLNLADAGIYSVIVTNAVGAMSSAGAPLAVQVAPPVFQTVLQSQGQLLVTWNTVSNRVYQLQARNLLESGTWSLLGVPLTASGDSLSAALPIGPGAEQFYRVMLLP
jgi:hypothetical protein